MRRSKIFEKIYKELHNNNLVLKNFTRDNLRKLIKIHQKYSVFIYKHSDENSNQKLVKYFNRGKKINGLISFKIDIKVLKEYRKFYNF